MLRSMCAFPILCKSLCIALLGVCLSATVHAAPAPFPDSQLIEESEQTVQRYRLVLSELKRQRADTFGERELRVAGDLSRQIYDLPNGVSLEEARQYFRLQSLNKRTLYECIGIDCGSSNFWANDVFGVSSLVSRDKDQAYFVTLEPYADTHRLIMVYLSMRGGRQPKVLIDQLVTASPLRIGLVTEDEVVASLSVTSGWLPGFVTEGTDLKVEESGILLGAIRGLSVGAKARLNLIVHCYEGAHMGDTLACSEVLAKQLESQLPGVAVRAHGALTPSPTADRKPAVRFTFWPGR